MILIIDKYDIPFELIKKNLFKNTEFKEIKSLDFNIFNELIETKGNYFLHSECFSETEIDEVSFYFDEIVDIKNQLVRFKRKNKPFDKKFLYYEIENSGRNINFVLLRNDVNQPNNEKNDFLPYLNAQDGEVVLFPSDEE